MTTADALITVAIIALVTLLTRALPFWLFPQRRSTPAVVTYLGRVLPYAVIGMLVVYCLKDVRLSAAPHGLPEAAGVAVVVLLHLWRKNTLLSIAGGTICYMLIVQQLL